MAFKKTQSIVNLHLHLFPVVFYNVHTIGLCNWHPCLWLIYGCYFTNSKKWIHWMFNARRCISLTRYWHHLSHSATTRDSKTICLRNASTGDLDKSSKGCGAWDTNEHSIPNRSLYNDDRSSANQQKSTTSPLHRLETRHRDSASYQMQKYTWQTDLKRMLNINHPCHQIQEYLEAHSEVLDVLIVTSWAALKYIRKTCLLDWENETIIM